MSGLSPSGAEAVGQLPHRGRLAGAVDADDEHDARRRAGTTSGVSARGEDLAQFVGERARRPGPLARGACVTASSSPRGRGHARRRRRAAVPRAPRWSRRRCAVGAPVRRVGAADDLVEPLREPFRGARQPLRQLVEQAHQSDLSRAASAADPDDGPVNGADSVGTRPRWRRPISAADGRGRRDPPLRAARRPAPQSAIPRRGPRRARARRRVVRTPSATIFVLARISASVRPRASSMPTWRLRLSWPVHVKTRSPMPASPASVSRSAAGGDGQARDLGQAAGDQRGLRVVPEAEALDDAGGDGDDVLQRAAELHADDVGAGVQAQRARPELLLHVARPRRRRSRRRPRRWAATARARAAKLGPDSTATSADVRPLRGDHLRHPQQRAVLEALRGAEHDGAGVDVRRRLAQHRAQAVRRHRDDHELRVAQRCRADRSVTTSASGNGDLGQVHRHWRGAAASRPRAPHRGPTAAPRARPAPDGRPAPCPSCRRRAPRRYASGLRAGRPAAVRCRAQPRAGCPRAARRSARAAPHAPRRPPRGAPPVARHRRQRHRGDAASRPRRVGSPSTVDHEA